MTLKQEILFLFISCLMGGLMGVLVSFYQFRREIREFQFHKRTKEALTGWLRC